MKGKSRGLRLGVLLLSAMLVFSTGQVFAGSISPEEPAGTSQITLTPAQDGDMVKDLVDILGGGDGLYKQGLNGMDMYDYLGYVFMGWRTTGGTWQNFVINDLIMRELKNAGYVTTDEDVVAPYGQKSASDKSDETTGDLAWVTQFQGTSGKNLGDVWNPEYAKLDVKLVKADGTEVNDEEAKAMAAKVSAESATFDPTTETYQRAFADIFGMDYDNDIATLPTTLDKVTAMHDVLMKSDVPKDERTTVDDFEFIQRASIGEPNKEAMINLRTRLAWNSSFTAPSGTKPSEAAPLSGEFIYVGTVNTRSNTNSEGIPATDIAGKVILTDSSMSNGFTYAYNNGGIGAASKAAVSYFLLPKDDDGQIMQPWYTTSRYASGGSLANTSKATREGKPVVEWQFSNEQYDNLKALLQKANEINETADDADKVKVMADQIAIGTTYPMTATEGNQGKGQAVAIAEVKGSVHPDKRVLICAHVQEPGCNDNATGVAALLGLVTEYKKLIDAGKIERPECTMTFLWGDEMNLATYWMDSHPTEKANVIASLDMDMTGEDPEKTGGVMRIEKTPDPSATYNYTLDAVPWHEPAAGNPDLDEAYYDDSFADADGSFVRLPDSHTLWGAGSTSGLFADGWYLNDLYMYVTSTVIDSHDKDFQVDVCPYEGGSDHSRFLAQGIPSMLTWHFTDYTYHTSTDTLYMSSPRELESVAITTLATGLVMSDLASDSDSAIQIAAAVSEAAQKRMETEKINTANHYVYAKSGKSTFADAYDNEVEVLNAWGDWYNDAIASVLTLVDTPSEELKAAVADYQKALKDTVAECLENAKATLSPEGIAENAFEAVEKMIADENVSETAADDIMAKAEVIKLQIEGEDNVDVVAAYTKELTAYAERIIAADKADQEQKAALEEQKTALEDQKASIEEQKTALEEQKQQLDDQKTALEEKTAELEKSAAEQKQQLDEQKTALEEKAAELKNASDEQKQQLAEQKTALEEKAAELEKTAAEQKKELEEKISALETKQNEIQAKLNFMDAKFKLSKTKAVYTGKAIKPAVTMTFNGDKMVKGTDYTVKYTNNTKVGKATVTISGKGNFDGTAKLTFKINPKKAAVKSMKAGKKKITVKWAKVSAQCTGYQVKYSTSKSFSGAKTVTIKSYKTTSKTIKKLKAKKTYYAKVRTYKTVNGVKYYGAWSKVKKAKTL